MILEPQPWSCLPIAVATALDIPFADLIKQIGHDGSELVYNDKTMQRSFHVQECIDVATNMGVACVPIECHYALTPNGLERYIIGTEEEQLKRFQSYLDKTERGFFEGMSMGKGPIKGHAVAWVNNRIVDSKGRTFKYKDRLEHKIAISRFWRCLWL